MVDLDNDEALRLECLRLALENNVNMARLPIDDVLTDAAKMFDFVVGDAADRGDWARFAYDCAKRAEPAVEAFKAWQRSQS